MQGLFMDANFRGTHNSYSGNTNDGHRGSIIQQLDLGLRYIELDIIYSIFMGYDFHVGHSADEDRIDHSHGNPSSHLLSDWLTVIKNWSDQNPSHAPVVIAIETKNELADYEWDGMNKLISEIFGGKVIDKSKFNHATATYASVKGKIFIVSIPENSSLPGDESYIFKAKGYTADPAKDSHVFYTIHADKAQTPAFVQNVRNAKKSIRLAFFTSGYTSLPIPNYPSCDEPYFGWYASYCEDNHVVPDFNFDSVSWLAEQSHDTGIYVDCAVNSSGYVVEVHHPQNNNTELWYNTGKIAPDGQTIQWFSVPDSSRNYDTGRHPSVAINDAGMVVEVHGSENNIDLFYRTGTLDINTGVINWLQQKKHDEGHYPSVAINNENMVVEVHQSENHTELWYNVGKVNQDGTIKWGDNAGYRNYTSGKNASVALHGDQILEVHNSAADYMWCLIGLLNVAEKKIDWKDTRGHSTHCYPFEGEGNLYPDVAFNGSSAVEVQQYSGNIRLRPGKLSNTVMAWGARKHPASSSSEPSVAMNNNNVLLFYNDASKNLKYQLGTLSK
ncbi:MAG: phosphatidylinositol-specific phospholipase C domain-containing protein [bacterium]